MSATEDAAVLLADFVSSLDNLPSEVCHILEEIGHKEGRVSDLKARASQRDQNIQKHAKPAAAGGQGLLVPNPKEDATVQKIRADLEKAEVTTREKVALSERGVNLLSRHLNRLQAQLELLTSSVPPLPTLPAFTAPTAAAAAAAPPSIYAAQPGFGGAPAATGGYNPYPTAGLAQAGTPTPGDKRRASGAVPLLPAHATPGQNGLPAGYGYVGTPGTPGTPTGGAGSSRRNGPSRLQNVAYASPGVPGTPQAAGHGQQATTAAFIQQQQQMQAAQLRIAQAQAQAVAQQQYATHQQLAQLQAAQQAHTQAQAQAVQAGNKRKRDQDDGRRAQDDLEGEAEGEDMTPYCFCHRPSFGEMIGCDAPDCKIEWFHLNCIGLKESPEGSWYCSQCEPRMRAQQARGGRKR